MDIFSEATNALNSNASEDELWRIEARLGSMLTKKKIKLRQENQDYILDLMDRIEGN